MDAHAFGFRVHIIKINRPPVLMQTRCTASLEIVPRELLAKSIVDEAGNIHCSEEVNVNKRQTELQNYLSVRTLNLFNAYKCGSWATGFAVQYNDRTFVLTCWHHLDAANSTGGLNPDSIRIAMREASENTEPYEVPSVENGNSVTHQLYGANVAVQDVFCDGFLDIAALQIDAEELNTKTGKVPFNADSVQDDSLANGESGLCGYPEFASECVSNSECTKETTVYWNQPWVITATQICVSEVREFVRANKLILQDDLKNQEVYLIKHHNDKYGGVSGGPIMQISGKSLEEGLRIFGVQTRTITHDNTTIFCGPKISAVRNMIDKKKRC